MTSPESMHEVFVPVLSPSTTIDSVVHTNGRLSLADAVIWTLDQDNLSARIQRISNGMDSRVCWTSVVTVPSLVHREHECVRVEACSSCDAIFPASRRLKLGTGTY